MTIEDDAAARKTGHQPTALVDSFKRHARSERWDTHAGSSGRCWFIARAFAEHATDRGHAVEIWAVTNPRSTRPADDRQHFAVVDDVAAVDLPHGVRGGAAAAQPRLVTREPDLGDLSAT